MLAKETKRKRGQNNGQISISAKIFLSFANFTLCTHAKARRISKHERIRVVKADNQESIREMRFINANLIVGWESGDGEWKKNVLKQQSNLIRFLKRLLRAYQEKWSMVLLVFGSIWKIHF